MSEISAELNKSHEKMRGILNQIQPPFEVYPTWTIKEVLAHIVGWDEAMLKILQKLIQGVAIIDFDERGTDFYNSESVATRTALNLQQVIAEWEQARQELIQVIDGLNEQQLNTHAVAPWGGERPIQEMLLGLAHHESSHADEIQGIINNVSA